MTDTITQRGLNRATLHRQLLLDRADRSALDAVGHLVGMQAQVPDAPYHGLWSRLRSFRPAEPAALTTGRAVVRATLFRATIHLVTAADHGRVEPLLRRLLHRRPASSPFGAVLPGLDVDEFTAAARELVEQAPRTRPELSRLLGPRRPALDAGSLGHIVTALPPLVQVTPRGVWGATGRAAWTTASHWLGPTTQTAPITQTASAGDLPDLVRRYLAAFGPATAKDVRLWSGLTRLGPVVEGMDLRVLHDDRGRTLFDVPDGPLPDPDTPAPARFLPGFDNLLPGHDDRTRVISDEDYRRGIVVGGKPTLLVDGVVHGTWKLTGSGLDVRSFRPLTRARRDEVETEGARLLEFAAVPGDVRIADDALTGRR